VFTKVHGPPSAPAVVNAPAGEPRFIRVEPPPPAPMAPINRFEAIFPAPELGALSYEVDWTRLDRSGKAAAAIIRVWVYLTIGLLAAFAISFYFCSNTWVYLLLRRSADGTDFEEVYLETAEPGRTAGAPPDEIETPAAS